MNILDCISPNSCRQRKFEHTNLREPLKVLDPSQKENTEEYSEFVTLERLNMDKVKLVNSTIWFDRKSDNCKTSWENLNEYFKHTDDKEFNKTEILSQIRLTRPIN